MNQGSSFYLKFDQKLFASDPDRTQKLEDGAKEILGTPIIGRLPEISIFRTCFPHLDKFLTSSCGLIRFMEQAKKCRNAYLPSISALYPEGELNPHVLNGHRILSPACLPVPPPGRRGHGI